MVIGSPPLMDILRLLRPSLWFAAHLHTKFAAVIPHFDEVQSGGNGVHNSNGDNAGSEVGWDIDRDKNDNNLGGDHISGGSASGGSASGSAPVELCRPTGTKYITTTKFLALDKCLPGRDFLQIVDVPIPSHRDHTTDHATVRSGYGHGSGLGDDSVPPLPPPPPPRLQYDPEWLAILRRTHSLLSTSRGNVKMPAMVEPCSEAEIQEAGSFPLPPLSYVSQCVFRRSTAPLPSLLVVVILS